jgi:hypothetical protein
MQWEEAKRNTLTLWSSIRDSIGTADPVTLLTEINGITDLCVVSRSEAQEHGDLVKCHYCPAYSQFGGCKDVCGELSDLVARKQWDELRAMIQGFIDTLETMETPPEPVAH